jgi:hypothetical protein
LPAVVPRIEVPDQVGGPAVAVRFQILTPGFGAVLGSHRADRTRPEAPFIWRLLGSNNYELGRSGASFQTPAAARQAIAEVTDRPASLERTSERDESGRWRWWLRLEGRVVATSSRSFRGEREAWANLDQFIDHLPQVAELPTPRLPLEQGPIPSEVRS